MTGCLPRRTIDLKLSTLFFLMLSTGVRICLLPNLFFPLFKSRITRKAFVFNKNRGNNQKVENNVSDRVGLDVGRGLLFQ